MTLSAQGLSDLQAANPDYDFSKLDPTTISATFSITKAPITITAPTATKVYDGTPYADALTATVTGQPTKGVAPVYTLNDVSGDVNVGEYALTVTADPAANKNYDITVAPGKLTITPAALTIAAPTVTKVYDGKGYTTALTGTVTTVPTAGVTPTYTLTDVSGDKKRRRVRHPGDSGCQCQPELHHHDHEWQAEDYAGGHHHHCPNEDQGL